MKDNRNSGALVRPVRRDQPDIAKLARALITLAQTEARRTQEECDSRDGTNAGKAAA